MPRYLSLNKIILIAIMAVLIFMKWGPGNGKSEGRKVTHFEGSELVNPFGEVEFSKSWFEHKYQVVIYETQLDRYSILNFDWESAISNNPEYRFVFYFSGKSKDDLEDWLRAENFRHPLLFDPNKEFYRNNIQDKVTGTAYILKNKRIVKASNPSIPNFQSDLDNVFE
jgi:hypothetical protein